jgi:hypothetical protein
MNMARYRGFQDITVGVGDPLERSLEPMRPAGRVEWELVIGGRWDEDPFHGGHVEYYLAQVSPGHWLLDCVERNADLDDVTQDDVDDGRLNDDQIQAIWGMTLEEAQAVEYREIVAACSGVPADADPRRIARMLYKAVCEADGKRVTEPDGRRGLLRL